MVQEQISKNSSIKVWSSWTEERHLGNTTNNGKHIVKSLMMMAYQLKLQNCLTSRTSSENSVTKKKFASFKKVRKSPPVNPFLPAREKRHFPQVVSRTRKHKEASHDNRSTWKETKQRRAACAVQGQSSSEAKHLTKRSSGSCSRQSSLRSSQHQTRTMSPIQQTTVLNGLLI